MKLFRYNPILLAFIGLGLVASLIICWQRYEIESKTYQVDLATDYKDLVRLADIEALDLDDVLNRTKKSGITSLAVYDKTLMELSNAGRITIFTGKDLLNDYHTGRMGDPELMEFVENGGLISERVYLIPHDLDLYNDLKSEILLRVGSNRIREIPFRGSEMLEIRANFDAFVKLPMGFLREELEKVNSAGFYVLARPKNFNPCTPEYIESIFKKLDGIRVSEVVIDAPEMLGAPDNLQTTIDEMRDRNLILGLIEAPDQLRFYNQAGMYEVARGIGYDHVARLYAIPKDEQPKLKIGVAIARWGTSDQERNIRINLLRPFEKTDPGKSLIDTNMNYFRSVHDLLKDKGYSFGQAATFEDFHPMLPLRIVSMIGVAATIILFLTLISRRINSEEFLQLLSLFFLSAAMIVPLLMGGGGSMRLFAAFASATLFPALAMTFQMDRVKMMTREQRKQSITFVKLVGTAFAALIITGAISMMGAVYLSASLSDVEYFLEFQVYRGVKLTFILPIIFVAIAFLQRFDLFNRASRIHPDAWIQFKKILEIPVKVKTIFFIGLAAVAGIVLIARSGHTAGMPVSQAEISFRSMLENMFYARPRSKELLIGHPAFMLSAMVMWMRYPLEILFVLALIATIGQSSMVETFCHMRTPFDMSLARGIGGLILGGILGAIFMLALRIYNMIPKHNSN